MKNRYPCGSCSGGCRNCPYLLKKSAEKQTMPGILPAMAPADSKTALEPKAAQGGELAQFLAENPKQGKLRVQAFLGSQAVPVPGVHVTVSRDFDGKPYVFYQGDTDMSGVLDQILLPAPARASSLSPDLTQPSGTYRLTATHPQLQSLDTVVDIYENVKTVQLVQMLLKTEG